MNSALPPLPEPCAYGLLKPDGTIDTELIGSKQDCEYWSRADKEPQSGWPIVGIYHDDQMRAYGEACAAAEREACAALCADYDAACALLAQSNAERDALRADAGRYRWLFPGDGDSVLARVNRVYRECDGQSDWSPAAEPALQPLILGQHRLGSVGSSAQR